MRILLWGVENRNMSRATDVHLWLLQVLWLYFAVDMPSEIMDVPRFDLNIKSIWWEKLFA